MTPEQAQMLVGREFVHFKGNRYRLVAIAKHSETLEPVVVYRALYGEGGVWVRPFEMFFGDVDRDGYRGPRFRLAEAALRFLSLREAPELAATAAAWFHEKWQVPEQAYLGCMNAYLSGRTEYGWYLCLDGGRIVGGLGVVENDFHDRKDLSPNICAVYTEEAYRRRGIAGRLLGIAVEDLRAKGVSPVFLLTDHVGFYERYGWTFLCLAQGDGDPAPSRMYVHG